MFHQTGPEMTGSGMSKAIWRNPDGVHLVASAFAGPGGEIAASSRPRFAPIGMAIGLSRDAQICPRFPSPASRDPAKYPG
jgi:hypothetical protein